VLHDLHVKVTGELGVESAWKLTGNTTLKRLFLGVCDEDRDD
jgi:hypothetical protein